MPNDMKSFISEKLEIRKDNYSRDINAIKSDYNREVELLSSYRGREILELLQNAEDELLDDLPKEVKISFDGEYLSISNYGEPFSEDGIISLMYSNNSGKGRRKKKVIGCKGTGFRAILGWAKEIKIHSGNLHVRFSHQYAQQVLKEDVFKGKLPEEDLKVATLVFPEWIEEENDGEYTTEISLKVRQDKRVIADITKQLNTLDSNLLLFLNRTEKLTVEVDHSTTIYSKEKIDRNSVLLCSEKDGEIIYEKKWYLNKAEGKIGEEYYGITIAYDEEVSMPQYPYIYTYFRTDIRFPFPVLLHADFKLNGDRNHLVKKDDANKEILDAVADLLIDTAVKRYKEVSYDRLKFLNPGEYYAAELNSYNFGSSLREKIKNAELFPTVNKKYVAYSSDLKFFDSKLAQYLNGKTFNNLLMCCGDYGIINLLRNYGIYGYGYTQMCEKVSAWVRHETFSKESVKKIAYTAVQFLEEYRTYLSSSSTKPTFFYNLEEKLCDSGKAIFLLDQDYAVSKPPRFANIEFMHPDMRNSFYELLKNDEDGRADVKLLVSKLSVYDIREYTASELVDYITDLIKEKQRAEGEKVAINRWRTMMSWLWENKSILLEEGESLSTFFLSRTNNLIMSDTAYYGKEYGNDLIDELIGSFAEDLIIKDIRQIVGTTENDEVIEFLELFDIAPLPRRYQSKVRDCGYSSIDRFYGYPRKVFSQIKYPLVFDNKDEFKSLDDLCSNYLSYEIIVYSVENLAKILDTASTSAILKWIQTDKRLKTTLYNRQDEWMPKNPVKLLWGSKQTFRNVVGIKKPYSYICNLFCSIPWIEVNGKRYSVKDCILGFDTKGVDLSKYLVEPDYANYVVNTSAKGKAKLKREYQDIFEHLGIKKDFSELPLSKIYQVLLELHKLDGSEELAKSLYNSLIDNNNRDYEAEIKKGSSYRETFINNGLILTNNGFQPVSETYYLDGRDLCKKVANSYNLIVIPKKRNKKRIKLLFGIDKLNLIGKLNGAPIIHKDDKYFQGNFLQFKKAAYAYRIGMGTKEDRSEARKFASIAISLCTSVKATYSTLGGEEKDIELDDYEYILDGNSHYYLKVPESLTFKEMQYNIDLAAAIANVFSSYLDVDEIIAKFRELFFVWEYDERCKIIYQEYEDDNILAKVEEALDFKDSLEEEFTGIIKKISGKEISTRIIEKIQELDFNNLNASNNAPAIIEIFSEMDINIEDYNADDPSIMLNIKTYFEKEVDRLKPNYEEAYKTMLYKKYEKMSLEEKVDLVDLFMDYNKLNIHVENDIYYIPKEEIVKQLRIDTMVDNIDFNKLYHANYRNYKRKLEKRDISTDYVDEFLNRTDNMSLLYYGEYEELINRYTSYYEMVAPTPKEETSQPSVDEIPVSIVTPDIVPNSGIEIPHSKTPRGGTTGYTSRISQKDMEVIGLMGEEIVYKHLCKTEKSVIWRSENAKKAKINPQGKAGIGYDIEYTNRDGERIFVEVKTSKTSIKQGIHFFMSDNECDFGKKNAENYEVFYVTDVTTNPQIVILKDLFKNQDFNKEKYSVNVKNEYQISADVVP